MDLQGGHRVQVQPCPGHSPEHLLTSFLCRFPTLSLWPVRTWLSLRVASLNTGNLLSPDSVTIAFLEHLVDEGQLPPSLLELWPLLGSRTPGLFQEPLMGGARCALQGEPDLSPVHGAGLSASDQTSQTVFQLTSKVLL